MPITTSVGADRVLGLGRGRATLQPDRRRIESRLRDRRRRSSCRRSSPRCGRRRQLGGAATWPTAAAGTARDRRGGGGGRRALSTAEAATRRCRRSLSTTTAWHASGSCGGVCGGVLGGVDDHDAGRIGHGAAEREQRRAVVGEDHVGRPGCDLFGCDDAQPATPGTALIAPSAQVTEDGVVPEPFELLGDRERVHLGAGRVLEAQVADEEAHGQAAPTSAEPL